MTTYAIEEVQRLNTSLIEFQRDLLCTTITTNTAITMDETSLTPKQAWEQKNKPQFLFSANKALDASLKGVPHIEEIQQYLTWYLDFENTEQDDTTTSLTSTTANLEWLFVTKCTLGVYGHTLSNILDSTLPLSQSLVYWDSIYGNIWHEIYYGIQTVPSRLYKLMDNTRKIILDSTISTTASTTTTATAMTTTSMSNKMKILLTSPDHILGSLFPMTLQHNNSNRHLKEKRKLSSSSSLSLKYDPSKTIAHVIGKLYNTSLPLALIRDEIRQKRHCTRYYRSHQAATLGLLIKLAPNFDLSSSPRTSSIELQQQQQQNEGELSIQHVALGTIQCIKSLSSCLQGQSNILINAFSINANQNTNMQLKIDEIKNSLTTTTTTIQPNQAIVDLKSIVDNQHIYQQYLTTWKTDYGIPSRLVRYWLPGITIYIASKQISSYVFHRKDDIISWLETSVETIREFLIHWVWEPTLKVLDTIRVKEENQQFGVSSKEGLRSDLASLERMVVQFAKEHYSLSDQEIVQLGNKVRDGDMSVILRAYENEIKSPLKNAIRGDLIQTLLIQVQKTKVDVDMAMQALDKLLKSNELNFAFLAVAPSMLLTWASISWIKNIYIKRGGHKMKQIRQPIKDAVRRIERLLTLDSSHDDELTCESQGALLCELLLLRNYAQSLPTRNSIRELFIEDIRDLETVKLSKQQKVETIQRMYRTWHFLLK